MAHERPDCDIILPSPKRPRIERTTTTLDWDDLFREKTFFCGAIVPLLGLATTLVVRLVARRFGEWLKPGEPPSASDVIRDIVNHGYGSYFVSISTHVTSPWAARPLAVLDVGTRNVLYTRCLPIANTAYFWDCLIRDLNYDEDIVLDVFDEALMVAPDFTGATRAILIRNEPHYVAILVASARITGRRDDCINALCHSVAAADVIQANTCGFLESFCAFVDDVERARLVGIRVFIAFLVLARGPLADTAYGYLLGCGNMLFCSWEDSAVRAKCLSRKMLRHCVRHVFILRYSYA